MEEDFSNAEETIYSVPDKMPKKGGKIQKMFLNLDYDYESYYKNYNIQPYLGNKGKILRLDLAIIELTKSYKGIEDNLNLFTHTININENSEIGK